MSTLPKSRIRIAGDLFSFDRLVDQLRPSQTNQYEEVTPLVPRFHGADSLQVEIAVFNNGVLLTNLSAIAALELVIKPLIAVDTTPPDPDAINPDALRGPASNVAPIVCKRISREHFNATLTDSQWQSKEADKAHAIITLDSEEAALAPGERWLSLIALGDDGQARTLAAGPILILGGGPTFNALPQPIVKDLRDQAATSAAQALASANNTAASAQGAHNAVLAAQEQVMLAELSATNAAASAAQVSTAVTIAQSAASQSAQARDGAQQHAATANAAALAAQQTADTIGDLATALTQATTNANRSEAAAATAEDERWAAAAYAAMLNPQTKVSAGGIYKESTGSITLDQPVTLGTTDFDVFIVASNVPRAQTQQDALLTTPTDERALISYSPVSGTWYVRDRMGMVRLSAVRPIPSEALLRLSRAGNTLSLTIDNEPVAEVSDIRETDFGQFRFVGCRNLAGTGFGWQGTLHNLCVFNRVLDAQEAATLTGSGGQIIPVSARNGRAEPLYASDFSAGVDNWTSSSTNTRTFVAAGALVVESVSGVSVLIDHAMPEPIQSGKTYRVTMDVLIPSATVSMVRIDTRPQNAGQSRPVVFQGDGVARDVWHPASLTYVFASPASDTASFRFVFTSPSGSTAAVGDTIHLRNIRIERVGCVLDLPFSDGSGYQAHETSQNANHALQSATGCAHLLPRREFEFVWTRVSSGFLGDADRPVLPDGAVIDSIIWEDAKVTRTTASLGFGESAAQRAVHVASFTPAQARQYANLTEGSIAVTDNRLYLHMSAAAGAVTLRVRGHVL